MNSNSSMKTWLRCQELYRQTYIEKIEPVGSDSFPAAYGRAFHGLVEGVPGEHFGAKWTAILAEHYNAWRARWGVEHENYWNLEFLDNEVRFDLELAPGYDFMGYIDGVVRLGGKNYLYELKTTKTKDLNEYIEMRLANSLQPGLYSLAGKHCENLAHYDIQGIVLDVTRAPWPRQGKSSDAAFIQKVADAYYEARETAFVRQIITYDSDDLHDITAELMLITDQQASKMYVKNRDSCFDFNNKCGFHGVCFGTETTKSELFQVRKRR